MINFHPTSEQLTLFAEGELAPVEAIVLSAHIDMCEQCNDEVQLKTDSIAARVFHLEEPLLRQFQLDSMLNGITSSNFQQSRFSQNLPYANCNIQLDGQHFHLPRTLRKYASKAGDWSYLVGKTWQTTVDLNSDWQASFLFFENGGHMPEHKYAGKAYWLVIEGELTDNKKGYRKGDFIFIPRLSTKAPRCDVAQGALMFTLLEKPLNFTAGLTNLLNPLSHLYT